ncbi:MAG: hypothetical protein M3277_08420 [Actinomycetota bacterium]|nr:hypothetical protein [Actinomycetota bacterium]
MTQAASEVILRRAAGRSTATASWFKPLVKRFSLAYRRSRERDEIGRAMGQASMGRTTGVKC